MQTNTKANKEELESDSANKFNKNGNPTPEEHQRCHL